jgi:hypothetical protein
MPSIKTIDDIKSSLLRPSLTSHYYVELALPGTGGSNAAFTDKLKSVGISLTKSQDTLNLLCSEASLPGSIHAHTNFFYNSIYLTFYVDVENYLPIMFFETWIDFASGSGTTQDFVSADRNTLPNKNYYYRMNYADEYTADQGFKVYKFEKDFGKAKSLGQSNMSWTSTRQYLEYEFYRSYPIAINSMPVSYETANLLKCTVSMNYIRYTVKKTGTPSPALSTPTSPVKTLQSAQNYNEYYNNFGDNLQNATNFAYFTDGSNQGLGDYGRIYGQAIG